MGMPAASNVVWTGRLPPAVSSILTESIPTEGGSLIDQPIGEGRGQIGMSRMTVMFGSPVPVPTGREQHSPAGDVVSVEDVGGDGTFSGETNTIEIGDAFEGKFREIEAVVKSVGRSVEVGPGVGNNSDLTDLEFGPLLVSLPRGHAGQKV